MVLMLLSVLWSLVIPCKFLLIFRPLSQFINLFSTAYSTSMFQYYFEHYFTHQKSLAPPRPLLHPLLHSCCQKISPLLVKVSPASFSNPQDSSAYFIFSTSMFTNQPLTSSSFILTQDHLDHLGINFVHPLDFLYFCYSLSVLIFAVHKLISSPLLISYQFIYEVVMQWKLHPCLTQKIPQNSHM